jgi:hypothetical protein
MKLLIEIGATAAFVLSFVVLLILSAVFSFTINPGFTIVFLSALVANHIRLIFKNGK